MRKRKGFAVLGALALAAALWIGCAEDEDDPAPPSTPAPVAQSNVRTLDALGPWGGAYPSDMVLGGTSGTLSETLFVT
ncbi:MAG: hypothetical protein ACYTHM_16465, partial [Planctomycetota bacterium]